MAKYKEQILTAIGVDSNQQILLLAFTLLGVRIRKADHGFLGILRLVLCTIGQISICLILLLEANNAYIFTRFGLGVVMYGAICIFHMSHATVAPLYSMNKIKCTFYVLNMNKIRCVTLHVYLPYIH